MLHLFTFSSIHPQRAKTRCFSSCTLRTAPCRMYIQKMSDQAICGGQLKTRMPAARVGNVVEHSRRCSSVRLLHPSPVRPSQPLPPTLGEDRGEAKTTSHKLMLGAGLIRKV